MRGADCWLVSEWGTENILASDSSSESQMIPNLSWFFVAGKDWSRLRFGSKYSTLSWIFRKDRIVGVSWRWFPRPRSSSVVVQDFCSLTVRARCCRTVSLSVNWKFVSYRFLAVVRRQSCPFSWVLLQMLQCFIWTVKAGSEITENGLLSGRKRRKRSMAALRWISLMNFCKLTVCHFFPRRRAKPLQKNI